MLLFFASFCFAKNNKVNKINTLEVKQNIEYYNRTNSGLVQVGFKVGDFAHRIDRTHQATVLKLK